MEETQTLAVVGVLLILVNAILILMGAVPRPEHTLAHRDPSVRQEVVPPARGRQRGLSRGDSSAGES